MKAAERAAAKQWKMNRTGGIERGSAKKMFFDGTNSRFYCKHRTYKSSVLKTNWVFSANKVKFMPRIGQKTHFLGLEAQFKGRKSTGSAA